MPLYEYQCMECGVRFERQQRFQEAPIRTCPECGGRVQRLIGPVGVIFKGSGFYATDHRSGSGPSSGKHKTSTTQESAKASGKRKDV